MSNNEYEWYDCTPWYNTAAASSLELSKLQAESKKRRRSYKVLVFFSIFLLIALLVVSSIYFAKRSEQANEFNWYYSTVDPEDMPDTKEEFFDSYYTSTDTDVAQIDIPRAELTTDYEMTLDSTGDQVLTLSELYEQCAPSIVAIYGYVDDKVGYYWGTGIILSEDGLILTNTHVIDGCDSASVKLHDNTEYEAALIGADAISDIAILKIEATGLSPASFGSAHNLAVGDEVAAIGNPLSENYRATLTNGIISGIERGMTYKGRSMTLLQTNTALNEGNSGGALFNMFGQVIGVTNMKMVSNYTSIEGIGFAIPSDTAKEIVDALLEFGEVRGRTSIGITVGAIPKTAVEEYGLPEQGLYVTEVSKGSDAERQGMKAGDIITQVNFKPVESSDDITSVKNTLEVGDVMIFTVWRDGEELEFAVALMDTNDLY